MGVSDLSIAIIQSHLYWEDIGKNIDHFDKIVRELSGNFHIVLLPEMFTTGFSMNSQALAEPVNGRSTKWMLEVSREKGFALGGSIIINEEGKFYNRFIFTTPAGEIFQYDKRHLFSLGNEHMQYTSGIERVVFEYLGWRILPQICYDLRFPVWSRNRNDYDLMINVANFPGSRREVWNTLLRARAIENQCYVAASNRIGSDGMGINYTGDSQLINARGQVIASLDQNQEGVITGSFNLDVLIDFRKNFPVLPDADAFSINI